LITKKPFWFQLKGKKLMFSGLNLQLNVIISHLVDGSQVALLSRRRSQMNILMKKGENTSIMHFIRR